MIGVIGVSYHTSSLEVREKITRAFSKLQHTEKDFIFLNTCHRAEWYFASLNPAKTHEAITLHIRLEAGDSMANHLFSFFGEECVYHLEKVVSGLDSLFLGETEIQGQVKLTYEKARTAYPLPKELHTLFQKALHTGKVLRSMMGGPSSLLQQEVVKKVLQAKAKTTLLIGASSINCGIASLLVQEGVEPTFTNRTEKKAAEAAHECGGHVLPWTYLNTFWCQFPCIITATRSPSYLISAPPKKSIFKEQLLIDLGVPRNINPTLGATTKLLDIESFSPQTLALKNSTLEAALSSRAKKDFLAVKTRG